MLKLSYCAMAPSARKRQVCAEHADSQIGSFVSLLFHNPPSALAPLQAFSKILPVRARSKARSLEMWLTPLWSCAITFNPGNTFSLRLTQRRCSWHFYEKLICCCCRSCASSGDFALFSFSLWNHFIWLDSSSAAQNPTLRRSEAVAGRMERAQQFPCEICCPINNKTRF